LRARWEGCRDVGFFYIVGYGVRPDLRKPFFDRAAASVADRVDS
jgi:hypothetical protein